MVHSIWYFISVVYVSVVLIVRLTFGFSPTLLQSYYRFDSTKFNVG